MKNNFKIGNKRFIEEKNYHLIYDESIKIIIKHHTGTALKLSRL